MITDAQQTKNIMHTENVALSLISLTRAYHLTVGKLNH